MAGSEVLEVEGAGPPVRLALVCVTRGAQGPVLEGVCPDTGAALAVPLAGVRRLRHADGREESPAALVARHLGRGWWLGRLDRLAVLAILTGAAWVAHAVQGPKDLGLYAVFWSFVLLAAGGGLAWLVLRRALGLGPR